MKEEDHIQANFHKWLNKNYPATRLLAYHIANEQTRQGIAQLVTMGLVSGIPDYHIAIARGCYHSMYIEFKSSTGNLSEMQKIIIPKLQEQGHYVVVCNNLDDAIAEFKKYWALEYVTDFELIDVWSEGWRDSGSVNCIYEGILRKAFRLGQANFIAGDDVSSVDLKTNLDIIKEIRGYATA